MKWIDIGVNLTNKRFDKDREELILAAEKSGVTHQIITGTNLQESLQAFELAKGYPNRLFSTAGCHPHDAKDFTDKDLMQLQKLLQLPSVVAVGECGLDFNRNFSPPAVQIEIFKRQLELAVEVQKPVFLHERDAFEQQYSMVQDYLPRLTGAVVHCFTGNQTQLEAYLELGLSIGITGWICDERRGIPLREIVHLIPEDKLMLETDAPYLLPRDMRPRPKSSRNLPQYLPHIAKTVAEARNTSLEKLSMQCYANAKQFFRLPI